MTKINLKEVFEIPFCKGNFEQLGKYCAVGKILKVITNSEKLQSIEYDDHSGYGYIQTPNNVEKTILDLNNKLGEDFITEVTRINDSNEGDSKLNHEKALKLLITECIKYDILTLDEESEALSKEFLQVNKEKEHVN